MISASRCLDWSAVCASSVVAASNANARARRIEAAGRAIPVLLAIGLVTPSVVWAALDHSIWPWDPSWYGEVSVDLWATLRIDSGHWPGLMTHAFAAKPPAIAWLGQFFVPLGTIVRTPVALLLSIVLCQAVSLWLVYASCRRLSGHLAGILGALVVGAAPLFVSMSHEYFAEPIQMLSNAWLLLILASVRRWRPALVLWQFVGAVSLGMASKLSSPIYMAAPAVGVLFLLYLHRQRDPRPRPARHDWQVLLSAAAAIGLALVTVAWYRVNLRAALDHAHAAAADTGLYGTQQAFLKAFPHWVGQLASTAFLPYIWIVGVAVAATALASAAVTERRLDLRDGRVVAAVTCCLSLIAVLVAFALQPNQEPRYLLPLLPFVAATLAICVTAGRSRLLQLGLLLVLAAEFAFVTLQSFGSAHAWSTPFVSAPQTRTGFAKTLDEIVRTTCTPATSYKINMVGDDYPWFNANNLEMLAAEKYAEEGRWCYYTSLGYASSDPAASWQRVREFKPPYYIAIDYGDKANPLPPSLGKLVIPRDPFNRVNRSVFQRAVTSGLFKPLARSRRTGTVILQNRSGS